MIDWAKIEWTRKYSKKCQKLDTWKMPEHFFNFKYQNFEYESNVKIMNQSQISNFKLKSNVKII